MRDFQINKNYLSIDGKADYLISAEICYFRIEPCHLEKVLDKILEAGCNAVSIYIPWFVHEVREGIYDFEGRTNPSTNLKRVLEMIKAKDLLAFVRPGPYIYAESRNLGIPDWFLKNYPEARVMGWRDGELSSEGNEFAVPHNHPQFLKCVERWYEQVCEILKPYQIPEGTIYMIQACNEIPGQDIDDQNPDTLGLSKEDGLYPVYLRNKYKTIEGLNAAYDLNFMSFTEIKPADLLKNKVLYETEHLEFYYTYYYPEYFKRLIEMFRKNGITVPVAHNAYNPRAVSLHYHTKKQLPELFVGVDCYYSMQGMLDAKALSYYCEFGCELLKSMVNCAPVVIEHESGYWHDYPIVYGPQLYAWYIWTFAAGYKGMNMYLFAGGENSKGMGYFGTSHNWQAPVTLRGEETETYSWVKKAIDDIKENREVFNGEKINDLSIGIYNEPGLIWRPISKSAADTQFMMFMNSLSTDVADIEASTLEELSNKKLLWVVSNEYMPEDIQLKLFEYAKQGGHLVLQGTFPYKDLNEREAKVLAEGLKARVYEPLNTRSAEQVKLTLDNEEIYVGKNIQTVILEGEALAFDEEGKPVIIRKEIGEGSVTVVPFHMEYLFEAQCRIIDKILSRNKINAAVKSKRLRCLVKTDNEGNEYLVALNYHPIPVKEEVKSRGKRYEISLQPYELSVIHLKE